MLMRRIAYGVTALFTVAVVVMELFLEEPPVLLLFGVASLALVGSPGSLDGRPRASATTPARA